MSISVIVRTDGLTAEDRSQRDRAGVLRVVKFREPFPGKSPLMVRVVLLIERVALRSAAGLPIGLASRLIPMWG